MFDLSSLNSEQKKAVEATEGAVLVLAGAGTGKTRVLTSRIAHIVSLGLCSLTEILAVTFTNKAANEMKERAIKMVQSSSNSAPHNSLWIGTFHSLSLRIIRPYHEKFGRTANFTIIDADDQLRLIKKIMKEQEINDKKYQPRSISFYINRWKDQLKNPEEAKRLVSRFSVEEMACKIYKIYQDILSSLDAMDFGDILMYCVDLLKTNEEILSHYQERFKYIMVDEYQDTNVAQYMWLRLLSMNNGNICCVGDDDQSIYSWRGADVENILKFEHDFKDATVLRLEQNYRSTGNILKAANGLISNNSNRMTKNLWTEKENGLPIIIKSLGDPHEEASFVAALIENKKTNGINYNDVAILVRAAFQTRAFEERFLCLGIPYNIIGGLRFYERKEVKDAIAYLRLAINPDDGVAFERIVNVPKRGIGDTSIKKFYAASRELGISLPQAARSLAIPKLDSFFNMIEKWREMIKTYEPSDLMKTILEESGYIAMLKEKNNLEDESRIETLKELVNALNDFKDINEFLDYVSLVFDNADNSTQERVTISTIHAAKGLEYTTVFIPGFEENLFPHQRSVEEKGELGIEEERRLCYVAITRAKKETYITLCSRRNAYGGYDSWQYVNPSRFLSNIPKGCVKVV